jgi:L-asparaginase/N4-(beta-N-acetylglucosaminyl)-L-asparaginase
MIVVSTWKFGYDANQKAWAVLNDGGSALDAVVEGVSVTERDPAVRSVGYGGHPNAEGVVQVDGAVMDGRSLGYGAVAGLEGIATAAAVARCVMENTEHVLLVGEGARVFAVDQGFSEQEMLTSETAAEWEAWQKKGQDREMNIDTLPADSHDTIGAIALDANGDLAAACTTSGIAYKLPGRVGDSPLIGCGLYADNETGAAVATGRGEEIARTCGSFAIVNLMREGRTPQEACESVVTHLVTRVPTSKRHQMAYAAIDKDGNWGAAAARPPFPYAITTKSVNEIRSGFTLLPAID